MANVKKSLVLAALCVAAVIIALGYSAYGWMTMSRQLRAVGQNVSVAVPENLQISLSGTDGWSDTVKVEMKTIAKDITKGDTVPFDPDGSERFYLLPASSYSGVDGTIWQTGKANNDGSAASDAVFSEGHRIMWNESTSSFEGHYIDIPLYFRTDGETSLTLALDFEATSITPSTNNINKIVRVAFLNPACTAPSSGSDPLVLAGNVSDGVFDGKVILSATEKTEPKYLQFVDNKSKALFAVAPGAVTQITVRIWVEGQDRNCVALVGGQEFSVSLGFCVIE